MIAGYCLAIAVVVPSRFQSSVWLLLFVPPSIVLSIVTLVSFAFIFMPPKIAGAALCVSRFPRIAAISMTAGCGYLTAWFIHGLETGSSDSAMCLPGVLLLVVAWFISYKYPYESLAS